METLPILSKLTTVLLMGKKLYTLAILLMALAVSLFSCATGNNIAVPDTSLSDTRELAEQIVRELNYVRTNPRNTLMAICMTSREKYGY